jgi:hypothetical protein
MFSKSRAIILRTPSPAAAFAPQWPRLTFGSFNSAELKGDRDDNRRPCEPARGVEAAETSADNDDAGEVRV